MPLNTQQLNAHLRQLVQNQVVADPDHASLLWLMRGCVRHWRLGDADSREAAQTVARALYEQVTGRSATAADLHDLRHLILESDNTADGELA